MNNITYTKSYEFAIGIVKCVKYLRSKHKEFVLSDQLLRSGTSIGANVAESKGGISRADFSNKISLAYKECCETLYWLSLLKDTGFLEERAYQSLFSDATELAKILYSILKKTRINKNKAS